MRKQQSAQLPRRAISRFEHEQALDRTDQAGRQPVNHADLVPPLRLDPGVLLAYGSVLPFRRADLDSLWASTEVQLTRVDGRAPHRAKIHLGSVAMLSPGLMITIGPETEETRNGTFADLIVAHQQEVSEHALVHARSGKRVIFDSRQHGLDRLAPVIMVGGHLPLYWDWAPCPALLPSTWSIGRSVAGRAEITWRGRLGLWRISATHYGIVADCAARSFREEFPSLDEAMRFCINQDAR